MSHGQPAPSPTTDAVGRFRPTEWGHAFFMAALPVRPTNQQNRTFF